MVEGRLEGVVMIGSYLWAKLHAGVLGPWKVIRRVRGQLASTHIINTLTGWALSWILGPCLGDAQARAVWKASIGFCGSQETGSIGFQARCPVTETSTGFSSEFVALLDNASCL